jgi:hypothetical protein
MTTSPTAPDLDVLAGLMAEATPGPWEVGDRWVYTMPVYDDDNRLSNVLGMKFADPDREMAEIRRGQANTDLIVAAVNALPALIAAARQRDALLESLAPVIDYVREQGYTTMFGDHHDQDVRLVMRDFEWADRAAKHATDQRDEARAALGRVEALAVEEEDLARSARAELTSLHPDSREYGEWSNNAWHHEEAANDLRAALAPNPGAEQEGA